MLDDFTAQEVSALVVVLQQGSWKPHPIGTAGQIALRCLRKCARHGLVIDCKQHGFRATPKLMQISDGVRVLWTLQQEDRAL